MNGPLTLRRDRGGAYDPPLEVNRKQLKNRGPEAHQIFFLLLKFGSAIFGTIRWPVGVTGGHRWPPDALWPYTRPKFQSSSIFIKLGALDIFWTLNTMVTSIFNEIDFLRLEIAFLVCRHTSKDNWRVRWVHLNKVWRPDLLAIIIAHEGLLLVQIWGPEDLPIPRSRGGAYAPPYPYHRWLRGRPTKG